MDFVILAVVFCGPVFFLLLLLLFFCEAHILDEGDKGVSHLLLVTPFIAITVLFLVTQVRFWSLLLHCKKNKPEEMGQEERPHSQICWVLRSDFFLPLEGEKAFFTGTLSSPAVGRYQFWTSATATPNAQRT